MLLVSFDGLTESRIHSFIVEFEQNTGTPLIFQKSHNFSIKPDPDTLPAMQMLDMESLPGKSSEITSTYGYPGSDAPPDDKPYKPHGFWNSLTTMIESVSWRPLYATTEVIGYRLLLTLQDDSLTRQSFLWIPVMATVVWGWLTRTHWNPELPTFNQLDEQESNTQHELQIITLMDNHGGSSKSSTTSSGNAGIGSSSLPTSQAFSFHSVDAWLNKSPG